MEPTRKMEYEQKLKECEGHRSITLEKYRKKNEKTRNGERVNSREIFSKSFERNSCSRTMNC
jgi:hypothetical protein